MYHVLNYCKREDSNGGVYFCDVMVYLSCCCACLIQKLLPVNIHIGYFSVWAVWPLHFLTGDHCDLHLKFLSEALSRIKLLNRTAKLTQPDTKGEEENEAQNARKVQNVKEYDKYSMAKEIIATLIITTDLADSWSKIPLGLDYTTYS